MGGFATPGFGGAACDVDGAIASVPAGPADAIWPFSAPTALEEAAKDVFGELPLSKEEALEMELHPGDRWPAPDGP